MKVAVLCEYSGVVRDAFIRRGHDAVSCDLLPSESDFGPHIQGDIQQQDWSGFDLVIAHPPCTHLAVSGARHFHKKQKEQAEALDFVRWILDLPVPRIALENPVSIISSKIRKPDQIIQPWQFGHPESKTTCLWYKNLPNLTHTNVLTKTGKVWDNQTPSGQNKLGPSPDRWKIRSATYFGIAEAMADQWGSLPTFGPVKQRTGVRKFGDQMVDDTVLLDPEYLDGAIVAVKDHRAIYDYDLLVQAYQDNEDAVEWVEYNTMNALPYMGRLGPLVQDFV